MSLTVRECPSGTLSDALLLRDRKGICIADPRAVHKQTGSRTLQHGSIHPDMCICLIGSWIGCLPNRQSGLQAPGGPVIAQGIEMPHRAVSHFMIDRLACMSWFPGLSVKGSMSAKSTDGQTARRMVAVSSVLQEALRGAAVVCTYLVPHLK